MGVHVEGHQSKRLTNKVNTVSCSLFKSDANAIYVGTLHLSYATFDGFQRVLFWRINVVLTIAQPQINGKFTQTCAWGS